MYDIAVAMRRFHPLIKWTAHHYANSKNYQMTVEDLEAEGLLMLVKCCQVFPKGHRTFARFFKRAWYNKLKKLMRHHSRLKRKGEEVDLETVDIVTRHSVAPDRAITSIQQRADSIWALLSPAAQKLLAMLLNQNGEEVSHQAYMDWCRKHKLRSNGQLTALNCAKFRLRKRHLRRALGMSDNQIKAAVEEIKTADLVLNRRQQHGKG